MFRKANLDWLKLARICGYTLHTTQASNLNLHSLTNPQLPPMHEVMTVMQVFAGLTTCSDAMTTTGTHRCRLLNWEVMDARSQLLSTGSTPIVVENLPASQL